MVGGGGRLPCEKIENALLSVSFKILSFRGQVKLKLRPDGLFKGFNSNFLMNIPGLSTWDAAWA